MIALLLGLSMAQEPATIAAEAEVVTAPETPVGGSASFSVSFTHTGGPAVSVDHVELVNTDGTGFVFAGENSFALPENGTGAIDLLFQPTSAGDHEAELTVVSDAACAAPATVILRAMAYQPCVIATPALIDFGPMDAPQTDTVEVTLRSCDGRTHAVDDVRVYNSRFTVAPVSFNIGPTPTRMNVQFRPIDDSAQTAEILIGSWETPIGAMANDCYAGDPALFDSNQDGTSDCGIPVGGIWVDEDGDGFTGADGDCDDDDAAIYPGAEEIDGGVDDNCNGEVDEHRDLDGDGAPVTQDCDDADPWVHNGGREVLDGLDNNCDGEVDELLEPASCTDEDSPISGGDCGCEAGGGPSGWAWIAGLALVGIRRRSV